MTGQKSQNISSKRFLSSLENVEVAPQKILLKKNFLKKKLLHGYSKIHELKLVTIGLASPEKIQMWAEKELPNGKIFGEVTNANTFHYRTFKPSKGGLFCERIFGPIKDFECACGKRQRPTALESKKILEHQQTSRYFCPNCDVEYTWSIIRRYQLGYIKLHSPVTHLWYFKTNPSYLSILFDIKRKHLESIIYCTETITIENTYKYIEQNSSLNRSPTDLYLTWQKFFYMEEKLKKDQFDSKMKEKQDKKKKLSFRNIAFNEKKLQKEVNWRNFKKKEFFKTLHSMEILSNSFSSPKGNEIEKLSLLSKKRFDTLCSISKQKQAQQIQIFREELWKKMLKNSLRNAIRFIHSQEYFSSTYFEKYSKIFDVFLFTSIENPKISVSSPKGKETSFLFLNFKNFLHRKVKNTKNDEFLSIFAKMDENDFSSSKGEQNFERAKHVQSLEKKKQKKAFFQSFLFFSEFALFFLSQKNKERKLFGSLSKKDFLFLINVLPFLKKNQDFQNLQIRKKKFKTLHSQFFKTLKKKSSVLNKFNVLPNFSFFKNLQFPTPLEKVRFEKKKRNVFLFEDNFAQQVFSNFSGLSYFNSETNTLEKISLPFEILMQEDPQKNFFSFHEKEEKSLSFQKIFTSLKTYYELDFCFHFRQDVFKLAEKIFVEKMGSRENIENFFFESEDLILKNSTVFFLFEKLTFEYFSFLIYVSNSNCFPTSSSNFQKFSSVREKFQMKKSFFASAIEIPSSTFFLFKNLEVDFFAFSSSNKLPLLPMTNMVDIENKSIDKKPFFKSDSLNFKNKKELQILKKPLKEKVQLTARKKELQNAQLQKFFSLDSFAMEFESYLKFEERIQNFSLKVSKFQTSESSTKTFSPFLYTGVRTSVLLKKEISQLQDFQKLQPKLSDFKLQTRENQSLKNILSTVGYHYGWANDSDWKYFLYYNSFFFSDFEDIPIFLYSSFSPVKKKNAQTFLTSQGTALSKKIPTSVGPTFSWPIDSSTNNFFIGAGIFEKFLSEYTSVELRKMTKQHQILLPKIHQTIRSLQQNAKTKKDFAKIQKYFQKREHIIRRLKFLRKFSRRNSNPSFMILKNLPVLPPDLRPILKLQNQIAASDLNRFYQRIIYRNERFKKFSKDSATNQSFEIKYAQRLLQEAVDNLIQNGKGNVKPETNSRGQPLKSLSEILKGKQGRFRQYLLGKRVDYSGRSVIVVGPKLKLYECGLPKEMAFELFLPFLIQYILQNKLAQTVVGAKNLLKADATLSLHLLNKVLKNSPVLLNRAPTLHRLGFQAFLPKLIDGRAILLHPMVCPGFNADFDGDQMAVHIPLTVEARTEAWKFMLSINNLINSATGEAIILPSQDMVLGCYYLTLDFQSKFVGVQIANFFKKENLLSFPFGEEKTKNEEMSLSFETSKNWRKTTKSFLVFQNFTSVLQSYQRQEVSLHTPVWVKWNGDVDFGRELSKPREIRVGLSGSWEQIQPKYIISSNKENVQFSKFIRTTPGRIVLNLMIQDCRFK